MGDQAMPHSFIKSTRVMKLLDTVSCVGYYDREHLSGELNLFEHTYS